MMDGVDDTDARGETGVAGHTASADDALLERLRVIEEQPLAERAASYAALHDELARQLDAPTLRADPS